MQCVITIALSKKKIIGTVRNLLIMILHEMGADEHRIHFS